MYVPLQVKLLNYTQNAAELIQAAVGFSYPTPGFDKIQEAAVKFASGRIVPLSQLKLSTPPVVGQTIVGYTKDDKYVAELIPSSAYRFIRFLRDIGHWKPFELVHATFKIEGLSRKSALHLLRYEFLTTNLRSQKYLNQSDFEFCLPDENEEPPQVITYLEQCFHRHQQEYETLRNMGADPEWARGVLPNEAEQTMSIHTNIRQWRHLFDCLCDEAYVNENRKVAMSMLVELNEVMPAFFEDFVISKDKTHAKLVKPRRNVKVNWELSDEERKALGLYVPKEVD